MFHGFFVRCIFQISLLLVSISSPAQALLSERLEGKSTLADIMSEVDRYYENDVVDVNEFESKYLKWKRWEWYMSGRLGHGGAFVNVPALLIQGMKESCVC